MKNIYMIGICGIAMGSLACMLRESGFRVSGSDRNMYPPMSDILAGAGIDAAEGFDPAHIGSPDLVIIGNAMSRGNPQVEHVLNRGIPYCSMAGALRRFFMQGKEVIAVTGTHGKTTTTSLLSHILVTAGLDPGCFIGGVAKNLGTNYRLGSGRYFVIEGDEYDSAFFEKIPKFMLYRPRHVIITSLEFDHADIYGSLAEIELWFRRLVNTVPSEGNIVYSAHYTVLERVVKKSLSSLSTFGTEGRGDITARFLEYDGDSTALTLSSAETGDTPCRTQVFGEFNMANVAAASSMALKLGVSSKDIIAALESFEGVKRRQELLFSSPAVTVYEDFAHHPTAIKAVLETMRKRYPASRIWAVYEPRSATSRRNVLQDELAGAFGNADSVLLKDPYGMDSIPESERIDMNSVVESMAREGKAVKLFHVVDDMVCHIENGIEGSGHNLVVVMSNGGFDGIYEKLVGRLKKTVAN